jgi:hypothetical protein
MKCKYLLANIYASIYLRKFWSIFFCGESILFAIVMLRHQCSGIAEVQLAELPVRIHPDQNTKAKCNE